MKTEIDFFIEVLKKELKQGDFKLTASVLLKLSQQANDNAKQYQEAMIIEEQRQHDELWDTLNPNQ